MYGGKGFIIKYKIRILLTCDRGLLTHWDLLLRDDTLGTVQKIETVEEEAHKLPKASFTDVESISHL